jgi:hypothetical protein
MSKFAQFLKQVLPGPLAGALRDARDWSRRAGDWPAATFHPWRQDSIRKLQLLRDQHRGQRCFIIGNGPSLTHTDLSLLKNEFTFGMNRFYLMFPELGFQTTFFVSINDLVAEQCAPDFQALSMPKFFSWRARKWLQPDEHLHFLYTTYTGPKFGRNAAGRLWESATVTYVSLQLAFHLGFQQAILIGVDHNFTTQGKPNTTVVSEGDDPNHFSPAYFGKGFRWQLPDLETSEMGYRFARQAYEKAGRQVLDATVGGKLTIFPRVDYLSLFNR